MKPYKQPFSSTHPYYMKISQQLGGNKPCVHIHPGYEIGIVIKGQTKFLYGDSSHILEEGDSYFINCTMAHGHWNISDNSFSLLWVHIASAETLLQIINQFTSDTLNKLLFFSNKNFPLIIKNENLLQQSLLETYDYYKEKNNNSEILSWLSLIKSIILFSEKCAFPFPQHQSDIMDKINKAMLYIESNLTKEFSLMELAEYCATSQSHLSALFKEYVGVSPFAYKTKLRIAKACSLLKGSDIKIENIAYECGYNSMSVFYEQFKKLKQQSPADYRKDPNS